MGAKFKIATTVLGDRRVGQIVDNPGLNADETIKEAIDFGYVVGKPDAIKTLVNGVLKAMKRGVETDGNGRKIDEVFSLQPYATGSLADVTDPITKDRIGAVLRARMLKEMKLDTSAFSFIIEGSTGTLRITVITTGEEEGVIVLGEETQLNGFEIEMHEGDKISYRVPETGVEGEIGADAITSSKSRITLGASALSELAADPANNGRDIVFTVKIGNKKVVKSATMRING